MIGLTALLLHLALPAAGSSPAVGELVEGRSCRSDPSQTYTLYLPPGFPGERRWPALIVMDPRGRSVMAAERFQPAAEELGWVLLSSNDTLSDGPMEPNIRALNALLHEVRHRYPIDLDRLYLAGFSGTAMFAWQVTSQVPIAGVIAAGGRFEPAQEERPVTTPTFGTAGTTDFNYREMFRVHELLAEWEAPQRLETHPGPHQWMPAELARQALEWHELLAMKRGLRPRHDALVERLFREDLAAAERLLDGGSHLAAHRRFDAVASTYDGLRDVAGIRSRAESLATSKEVRQALEAERDAFRYEQRALRHIGAAARRLREDPPIRAPRFRLEARLESLRSAAEGDGPKALAAGRALASLLSLTSFYMPRELFEAGDYTRAATALTVATELRPEAAHLWLLRARAEARIGDHGDALDSLERALEMGLADAQAITDESDFAPLRESSRFQRLVDELQDERGSRQR